MPARGFEGITPRLAAGVFVDETALVIGDVAIGADSSVWPFTVARGDVNRIRIGARTNIQDHCVLHVSHDGPHRPGGNDLLIGDGVTVGHRVTLHGCHIENDCLIGMGSIVMDGAVLGRHTLLGAGALIPPDKTLEPGYLWLGSPARQVRALSDEEIAGIEYSAAHYVQLKDRHLKS
ncbi:MAG TPA: gamma carbonic anhydrase family protein [Gammaproteobacteria bacterium]|nr:gamma carbonic anhydrase family protein [Gammaproteobacteria bacterium]